MIRQERNFDLKEALSVVYTSFLCFGLFLYFKSSFPGIDCGALSSTNIVQVTNTRFNGSSVTVTCENGYQVQGTTQRTFQATCQASGLWSELQNCVGELVGKLLPHVQLVYFLFSLPYLNFSCLSLVIFVFVCICALPSI